MFSSDTWKQLPASKSKELNSSDEDGEFWMSFDDVIKNFTDAEICSISMDELYEDDGGMYILCYCNNDDMPSLIYVLP